MMNTTQKIIPELTSMKAELVKKVAAFTQTNINTIPFEGSWTPGQVMEHIVKFASGMVPVMMGGIKPTHRDPDGKVNATKDVFMDFETKMKSPDFIYPPNTNYSLDELHKQLTTIMTSIIHTAETSDLTLTCTDYEIPGFGEFTRLEWLYFTLYHTKRHINQLDKIAEVIV